MTGLSLDGPGGGGGGSDEGPGGGRGGSDEGPGGGGNSLPKWGLAENIGGLKGPCSASKTFNYTLMKNKNYNCNYKYGEIKNIVDTCL